MAISEFRPVRVSRSPFGLLSRPHGVQLCPGHPLGHRQAVEAVHCGDFGIMTVLRGTDIEMVPLKNAVTELKTVPVDRMGEAESVY